MASIRSSADTTGASRPPSAGWPDSERECAANAHRVSRRGSRSRRRWRATGSVRAVARTRPSAACGIPDGAERRSSIPSPSCRPASAWRPRSRVRQRHRARLRSTAGSFGSRKMRAALRRDPAGLPCLPRSRSVGIVEQHAEIADTPDAGLRADRRLPGLDARIAENAFLRLAGIPVVVDLLVRAARDAHAPAAALVLIDQDDAVFLALVDRAGRTGRDAARVQAMLAEPRQIHHEGVLELPVDSFCTASKL